VTVDNETWIIDAGDTIVRKRADGGWEALSPLERLIHCLWVADYGMRNAGDLTAACDLYKSFHEEALQLSKVLKLSITQSAFALSLADLEQQYFRRFDAICDEIRAASVRTA
jgi:hypothetical protein